MVRTVQVSPTTADVGEAREWFEIVPQAMGVEGMVVKGASLRDVGGRREWLKVNSVGLVSVAPRRRLASSLVVRPSG